jgi:hypothetical protein
MSDGSFYWATAVTIVGCALAGALVGIFGHSQPSPEVACITQRGTWKPTASIRNPEYDGICEFAKEVKP